MRYHEDEDLLETQVAEGGVEYLGERRANDLDGRTWTRYSISIWSDLRRAKEEAALKHPAMFPMALPMRLIESFTRTGMTVLDPFVGVGTTVIAAQKLNRSGIGIELNPEYVEIAMSRLQQQTLYQDSELNWVIYRDDARRVAQIVPKESVDIVITSPPYWDILLERRTADYKPIRHYGDEQNDLGKIADYDAFLNELAGVFRGCYQVLRPGGYCCIVVMDLRKKGRFFPFHSDLAYRLQEEGYIWDDLIIWDRRHEYNNLRPLGYPFVFRINKTHEYILILKRP